MMKRLLPVLLAALALAPAPARAQEGGWNSPQALELIERARERRAEAQADTGLVDYQADARGYVYFYLDRRDTGESTLVKTDQVALDVFWKAPDLAKQRIVGLRDVKNLPTNIRYHEDHLTVVQDNFGDLIRLGDGDEVRDVLHPAAPGGAAFYDFRLADSLAIRLPGAAEPVRVYEVRVRPKDASRPALLGSVLVDRRSGDIVRMQFTFTRASYVDRQLDYINVLLENGLVKGRFWLPNRQQVEVRRELPELGFPVGGMIRGTMRVSNYRFNQDLPAALFSGPKVVSVPESQRRAFAFEQPLDAELKEQGLGADTELGEVRRQAAQLIRGRALSGLPAARLDLATASRALRYNRAEGVVLGAGARFEPTDGLTAEVRGGWAFGAEHPYAAAGVRASLPKWEARASGYLNRPRDLGVGPVVSGAMNTLSGLLAGRDYTDLFYASGASVGLARPLGPRWTAKVEARVEEQERAHLEAGFSVFGSEDPFRPVLPIVEGTFFGGSFALGRDLPAELGAGWRATLRVEGGRLDAGEERYDFARPEAELGWIRHFSPRGAVLEVEASGGAVLGDAPPQATFLIGGRGTVPGFPFRAFGGDRFALGRAALSAEVVPAVLRGRLFAAGGWTGASDAAGEPLFGWDVRETGDPVLSVGAGVGIFYDILRVDVARGVGPTGRWEVIVEANPSFWDFL